MSAPESDPASATPNPQPSAPGYEILGLIAQSGLTTVCRARDLRLGHDVAIKFHQHGVDPKRLVHETQITCRLQHPGIVPVHALGSLPDGRLFMVMKLIKGRTLAEILRERTSCSEDLPRLLAVFEQVSRALAYAHSRGVIHRNLKPSKVMIGAFGEVQLLGWGMARTTESEPPAEPGPQNIVGTPAYMPPEQARGEVADERSDVFGLGGLLCAILTGEPPFTGTTAMDLIRQSAAGDLTAAFARLDACGADSELIALAKRCLAPKREDRPANAVEVARAVTGYRSPADEQPRQNSDWERRLGVERRKRRRAQLALALAVTLGILGGGAFAWWQNRQVEQQRRERELQRLHQEPEQLNR